MDINQDYIELSQDYYDQIKEKVESTDATELIKSNINRIESQLTNVRNRKKERDKIHEEEVRKNTKIVEKVFGNMGLDE